MSSSAAYSASVYPPWTELPSELTANILQRLGSEEILQSAQFVCVTWWKVCKNPAMWKVIKIEKRIRFSCNKKLTMMCRRAVDLSQGQLIALAVSYFCDDELLHYIVARSSHLQRLTLAYCNHVSATSLIEAVEKLHELEELHLISQRNIHAEDIEAIGNISPLKSFTFNGRVFHSPLDKFMRTSVPLEMWYVENNEQALAIATFMPNLFHLGVINNDMNNEGLEAILDGCPHLESLDLRRCIGVDLGGALGKRCCEQIKHLRFPSGSIDDYEWDTPNHTELVLNSIVRPDNCMSGFARDMDDDFLDHISSTAPCLVVFAFVYA